MYLQIIPIVSSNYHTHFLIRLLSHYQLLYWSRPVLDSCLQRGTLSTLSLKRALPVYEMAKTTVPEMIEFDYHLGSCPLILHVWFIEGC